MKNIHNLIDQVISENLDLQSGYTLRTERGMMTQTKARVGYKNTEFYLNDPNEIKLEQYQTDEVIDPVTVNKDPTDRNMLVRATISNHPEEPKTKTVSVQTHGRITRDSRLVPHVNEYQHHFSNDTDLISFVKGVFGNYHVGPVESVLDKHLVAMKNN